MKESTIPDWSSKLVNIKWKQGAPAPVTSGKYNAQAVVFNGTVYVGGGGSQENPHFRIDIYHPSTDKWGSTIKTTFYSFAMTVLMDKLVIAGGRNQSKYVTNKVLALEMGQWKDYSVMPTARSTAVAVSHRSMMIIIGGYNGAAKVLSTTELLDAATGQWFKCDDLPQPLYFPQSVVVGDMLYMLGGVNQNNEPSKAVYSVPVDTLDSHQLKWQHLKDTPSGAMTAVGVHNKYLLVVGGQSIHDTVHVLKDGTSDSSSWKCIGSLPSVQYYLAAVSIGDKIITIGGRDYDTMMTNTVSIGTLQ